MQSADMRTKRSSPDAGCSFCMESWRFPKEDLTLQSKKCLLLFQQYNIEKVNCQFKSQNFYCKKIRIKFVHFYVKTTIDISTV